MAANIRIYDHRRFLAWVVLTMFAWSPALFTLVRTAVQDENYSYTLLVLGVSVALLCFERWPLPIDRSPSPVALCLAASALAAAAWLNFRASLLPGGFALTVSVVLWLASILAVFAYIYGWNGFWQLRFPFLFSLLAAPLPVRAISWVTVILQWGSADAAHFLFKLFGVPVVRDGLVFSFSNIEIEVAQQCSSIRSSTILVVTTVVIAQLFLKSRRSKWIAVLISLPVAILKNGIRIFTLSALGEYVSTGWLDSPLHHQGGVIFLALGLGIMFGVIWVLGRFETPQSA
jgi:exosortase